MKAYIKNGRSFTTFLQRDALSYDLYLDAMDRQASTVTITGDDIAGNMARNWLILNGAPYWIERVTPGKGSAKLSLLGPEEVLARQLVYTEGAETVGAFIAKIMEEGWIKQEDAAYALPYLTVTNHDSTPFIEPETDENGVFLFTDYLRAIRKTENIAIHWSIHEKRLMAEIRRDAAVTHSLIQNDGHTKLESSVFSGAAAAKITAVQMVDTGEKDENDEKIYRREVTVWYLAEDGSFSQEVPQNRAKGDWVLLPVPENSTVEEAVAAQFGKNTDSHKVELRTDQQMQVGDRFRIKISGEVFEGRVDSVRRKSGDVRPLYTAGSLATTLTDKVRALAERS